MKTLDLSDFAGRWVLERQIDDRRAGQTGHLVGIATFEPVAQEPETLRYSEIGQLRIADQPPLEATRVYFWQNSGDGIEVLFDDRRAFHRITPGRSMPDDTHHCDPDLYHVSYDFSKWPNWQAMWRVVGPRKDYRMTSLYRRA